MCVRVRGVDVSGCKHEGGDGGGGCVLGMAVGEIGLRMLEEVKEVRVQVVNLLFANA